ncbi:MAG: hypothetical protein ACUVQY_04145 [Thermoproteota archaeon]
MEGDASWSKPLIIGSRRQLFVDDLLIDHSKGISLRINPPVKAGPVIHADKPWEGHRVGAYGTVMEENGICKIWYDAIDRNGKIFHCYAISENGVNWEKPGLGLVEYRGSKDNNILPLPPCGTVFIDPVSPPSQRYKYVTYGHGSEGFMGEYGIRVWWSEDGLRWEPNDAYALPLNADTQNQAFFDDRTGKYVAYLRAWDPLRCIARAEVEDILDPWPYEPRKDFSYSTDNPSSWPAPTKELSIVFKYDEHDPEDSDHYNPCVIKYPYAEDVYYMFPSAYLHFPDPPVGKRYNDGRLDIQIATSRDGIHWNRLTRDTYVRLGKEGELDCGMMYMLVGMIRRKDEIWMYYAGYDYTHGIYDLEGMSYKGAIFRAVQRLDGFTSVDTGYEFGEFVTKPLAFKGRELVLNVDTSATGEVRVEIQDEGGRPFKGFDLESCDAIHANDCSRTVSWRGTCDVSRLSGIPVRLHFLMRNTKLYAFQFL